MDKEEKAKAYDEALERAKIELSADTTQGIKNVLMTVFPELAESEDEKIRKGIIDFLWKEKIFLQEAHSSVENNPKYRFAMDAIAWLEKQGKKQPIIVWHSINEEPEEMKELFCEWESDDATWHDVAFYDKESHTFNHAKMPINVTKWIYVDELLEKQGEQKTAVTDFNAKDWYVSKVDGKIHDMTYNPADKVESKFKVGDWIIHQGTENIYQVVARIDNQYQLKYGDNYTVQKCADVDRCARLWDITKDAKKGDVLEFIDHERVVIGIVSFVNERTRKVDVSCLLEDNKFKIGNFYTLDTINPHPATKEQRDTLEKAMADAGYTFDFEKKELKKIEQNPTWSEEDDYNLQCMIAKVTSDIQKGNVGRNNELIDWLKSLKERVQPQDECMDNALMYTLTNLI